MNPIEINAKRLLEILVETPDDKMRVHSNPKIIVSVKGGGNVSVPMIRDLGHVIDREKAVIGLLVTLTEPARPMREEAIKTGYYESPKEANFPKVQILTITGVLDGTEQPKYPDLMRGGLMFKKAKRESRNQQKDLFFRAGEDE